MKKSQIRDASLRKENEAFYYPDGKPENAYNQPRPKPTFDFDPHNLNKKQVEREYRINEENYANNYENT